MSVNDCEAALRKTAAELRPLLEPLGFDFHIAEASRGHQAFATGFFFRGRLKIGLIYRENSNGTIELGSVNYENDTTNAAHDQIMSALGFGTQQRLRHDQRAFTSMAVDGGSVIDALRADLVLMNSVLRDDAILSQAIGDARRKGEEDAVEAAARQTAKREAWLRRRRGNNE